MTPARSEVFSAVAAEIDRISVKLAPTAAVVLTILPVLSVLALVAEKIGPISFGVQNSPLRPDIELTRDEKIIKYEPHARRVAAAQWKKKRLYASHATRDDFEGQALLGLVKAVASWDPSIAVLKTHIEVTAVFEISMYLRSIDFVKRKGREKIKREAAAAAEGKPVTKPTAVPTMVSVLDGATWYTTPGGQNWITPLRDKGEAADETLIATATREVMALEFAAFTLPLFTEVLDRFFLRDESLEEIAEALSISKKRVMAIKSKALHAIRQTPFGMALRAKYPSTASRAPKARLTSLLPRTGTPSEELLLALDDLDCTLESAREAGIVSQAEYEQLSNCPIAQRARFAA